MVRPRPPRSPRAANAGLLGPPFAFALLRAAGLVTVIEAGSVIYYNLRRDRLETASGELGSFLTD